MSKQTILVIVFSALLLTTNITLWTYNWKYMKSEEYQIRLNHLNGSNDSISNINRELVKEIDSLKNQVAEVDSAIIEIIVEHEKKFDNIVNQPIAADVRFFSDYLSKNSPRLPNSNNSSATKTN